MLGITRAQRGIDAAAVNAARFCSVLHHLRLVLQNVTAETTYMMYHVQSHLVQVAVLVHVPAVKELPCGLVLCT